MTLKSITYIITLFILILASCYSPDPVDKLEIANIDASYAIPLINTKAQIIDVEESTGDNTSLLIADDGKMTVFYNGNVIRQSTIQVFPPVPGVLIGEFPLDSSETNLVLDDLVPFEGGFILNRATFKATSIQFNFNHNIQEALNIKIYMDAVLKDGQRFEQELTMYGNGGYGDMVTTPFYSLDGYTLSSDDNTLKINYEATTATGQKIELDFASLYFDILAFGYVEGFFTQNSNSESGDVITVGVYSTWISGGLDFEDPKVTIMLENSFGFPVRAKFNFMELTNILGDKFYLTGTAIDNGFDFPYPTLDEVGSSAIGAFVLDKNNSNIQEIFNEKVKLVRYDVTATGNPDNDASIIGFLTDSSFYNVDIAIELPLELSINNLILGDTFDIDLSSYSDVKNGSFKLLTENSFPFNMQLQAYFLDNSNRVIDSLFIDNGYLIDAAEVNNGLVSSPNYDEVTRTYTEVEFANIRNAEKIFIQNKFTNGQNIEGPQWIYKDYGITIKLGAILNIEK